MVTACVPVLSLDAVVAVPAWLAWYAETSEISTCWTTNRSSAQAVAPPAESVSATAPAMTARLTRPGFRLVVCWDVMPHFYGGKLAEGFAVDVIGL